MVAAKVYEVLKLKKEKSAKDVNIASDTRRYTERVEKSRMRGSFSVRVLAPLA